MAEEEKAITQGWCNQVRHACAQQVKERYDAMKELFTSKLEGVSEQLETTLQDLQKSLSMGSKRMADMDSASRAQTDQLRMEIKAVHERIDALCKSSSDHMDEHERIADAKFGEIKEELKELGKPPWNFIGVLVVILMAVGGSMLVTWRQVGVHDEKFENMRLKIDEISRVDSKRDEEVAKAILELKVHVKDDEHKFKDIEGK